MTRRRLDDPTFFEKEEALLGVGTALSGEYDERDRLSRRFARDVTARRLTMGAFLLASLAASGFGELHRSGQWQAVVPLGLLAVCGAWDAAWWSTAETGARDDRGVALGLALAFVILPALPWLPGSPGTFVPAVVFAVLLAAAWPFQTSTAVAMAYLRTAAALATYVAILLWPMIQVSSVPLLVAGVATLVVAAATFFLLAGPPAGWPAALDPRLFRRLSILALLSALFSPYLSSAAWFAGLGATLLLAALMRALPSGLAGRETPWRILLGIVAVHLWSAAFAHLVGVDPHPGPQMASAAVEYLAVALVAARWSKARLDSLAPHLIKVNPPAIVPLFDRAEHHALESWVE